MNASFSGRSSRWSFCGERERARMVVVRGRSGTPAPIMVLARACREPTPRSCTPPHLGRMDDSALPGLMARRPSDLFSRAAAAVDCTLAALSSTPPSTPLAPALRFAAGWLAGCEELALNRCAQAIRSQQNCAHLLQSSVELQRQNPSSAGAPPHSRHTNLSL
jgi:hypothetical protein